MGVHMKMFAVVLVLFSFLLSGCSAYNNLYGAPAQNNSPVYVPESLIVVQEDPEVSQEEPQSEEARLLAEELQRKIDERAAQEQPVEKKTIEEQTQPEETIDEQPEVSQIDPSQAIIVEETEKVSLQTQASDPDGDALTFAFTSPLDENGQWQTTYGDEGEYTATVTASDGDLTSTQDLLIIVNKKEESPVLESFSPQSSSVSLEETQSQAFEVKVSDLNKDPLAYEWKLDGDVVSSETSYTYQTTYDDSGSHTVKLDVSDGISSVSQIWAVEVANVNRLPILLEISPVSAKETDTITLIAEATDDDNSPLSYSISDARFAQEDNVFTWATDYDGAGSYTVTVSVSDGEDSDSQDVQITVANVNRKPVIVDITQKK